MNANFIIERIEVLQRRAVEGAGDSKEGAEATEGPEATEGEEGHENSQSQ